VGVTGPNGNAIDRHALVVIASAKTGSAIDRQGLAIVNARNGNAIDQRDRAIVSARTGSPVDRRDRAIVSGQRGSAIGPVARRRVRARTDGVGPRESRAAAADVAAQVAVDVAAAVVVDDEAAEDHHDDRARHPLQTEG
jgi:hypothetical protein